MCRFFIIALTLALASADDHCMWGESYWCVSLENAKQCGAFQHCLTTVWKNQKLEQDNSDICTYCENVIMDVKGFITNKQSWDQLQHYFDSACSVIPVEEMATKCKNMVNSYLPELLAMLEKDIDPQMICSLLGLCKGLKDTVQHHPLNSLHRVPLIKVPSYQADPICADCKKLMQDIKNDFVKSEKQIEQLLKQNLCKNLKIFSDECNEMVEKYIPQIMDMIASQFDPAMICQVLGFCNQTSTTPKALLAKLRLARSPLFEAGQVVGNSAGCEICKAVVGEIQSMEKEKMTQEELEDYLKKELCAKLGVLKDACDRSVDEYGPELFQLIYEELDPSVVCKSIGLCASGRLFNGILPVLPQNMPQNTAIKQQETSKGSPECMLCEVVVQKVDEMLSDNATEAEIEAALDKVCSLLPQKISLQCRNFVDTYGPAIITLLAQELEPHMVCQSLGICKEGQKQENGIQSGSSCEVCKLMMKYLDNLLTQNATIEEIELLVEKLCSYLPKQYVSECDGLVQQYGKMIIQLLSQYADPNEICQEIGLCDRTKKPAINDFPVEKMIVKEKVQLLGTNECTYGPAYWCASRENAKKCKAVAHCQKHVWKN